MLIASPLYCALIIPFSLLIYLLAPGRPRMLAVFAASWAFYLTFPRSFSLALLYVSVTTYLGALVLARRADDGNKLWFLAGTIALTGLPLLLAKYIGPLLHVFTSHMSANWDLTSDQLVFPVGLSFYTFGAIGYLIDVFLGVVAAEQSLVTVALLCCFFPIVTSGPIPRASNLLPQLRFKRAFDARRATRAVTEILLGVGLKFGISEILARPVGAVYSDVATCGPLELFLGTVFFGYQLYADFAGYSLVAIGSARLLGVDLPPNFRYPFLAASVPDFWRGWHISLFSWLRDYFFTPIRLELRAYPKLGTYFATFVTLVFVGIWHGAGWGFVAFGAVHGVLMVLSQSTQEIRNRLWLGLGVPLRYLWLVRIPITFIIITFTLVLLRSKDVSEAGGIYLKLLSFDLVKDLLGQLPYSPFSPAGLDHLNLGGNWVVVAALVIVVIGDVIEKNSKRLVIEWPYLPRAALLSACTLALFVQALSAAGPKPFAYFQF
jgi:D-alanyl-lipoteichoic acid acyltransferase DltB (MBOAT superfamily)